MAEKESADLDSVTDHVEEAAVSEEKEGPKIQDVLAKFNKEAEREREEEKARYVLCIHHC